MFESTDVNIGKSLHEFVEWVVIVAPAVVDEVEGHRANIFVDFMHRDDASGVDDGGVAAGFGALVKKYAIEYMAQSRF